MLVDFGGLDHSLSSSLVSLGNQRDRAGVRVAEPINFNKARKTLAAADARRQAAENRVRFGRTKAQKAISKLAAEKAARAHDQAKRED
jgi:hypothetical protein